MSNVVLEYLLDDTHCRIWPGVFPAQPFHTVPQRPRYAKTPKSSRSSLPPIFPNSLIIPLAFLSRRCSPCRTRQASVPL